MAKRNEGSAPQTADSDATVVYRYMRSGAYLPGIPARDLTTDDDLSRVDEIEASGLYRKV